MALNKQVHIYSIDTSAFYTKEERVIHKKMSKLCIYRSKLKKELDGKKTTEGRKEKIRSRITLINKVLNKRKSALKKLIDNNLLTARYLDKAYLTDRNVVAMFDSVLTRTLNMSSEGVNDDVLIVQTFYFGIVENIIKNGFYSVDEETGEVEKYIVYTASAGQIRTKKTMFIKESKWQEHKNTLLCGLSEEIINEKDGVNTNKYLAYLALNNSATDEWKDFDIDKAIVVNDMATVVKDIFDHIDHNTFDITREEIEVLIEHTDGCGMLPSPKYKKAHMVRSPFIKGLLVPFPFKKFIRENGCSGKVIDIYGKEWDIEKDNIEVIFTKSQFKMWKYYESWNHYKECYKTYSCQTGICNVEEDFIKDAKLNYQILQTLTDITDEELKTLASPTISDINSVGSDRETMLRILGVKPENKNKNSFQKALELYPEMLQEPYAKEVLKQTRQSLIKDAKAAKIRVKGKYTYVIPDLYAFCEWLFLGEENPKGLLKRGEVSCNMYEDGIELDCMRSPHLYKEHAIKLNCKNSETKRWFKTKGIYTSIDDSMSKVLMFDVDGDRLLISPDKTLIEVAKRNMEGIVPLYYEMGKAKPSDLNSEAMFEGLRNAYIGGNIGVISNDISKIWNSGDVSEDALNSVKILTAYNNFVIDYAKTLYKPTIPRDKAKIINKYTKNKLPHFFVSAKDKLESQVEDIKKNTTMGRLENMIPNKRLLFKVHNLKKFDYKMLMSNPDIKIRQDIIDVYEELEKSHYYLTKKTENKYRNIDLIFGNIKNEILKLGVNEVETSDILVKYMYGKKSSKYKNTLWECFGDIIINNIQNNLTTLYGEKSKPCVICGERIEITRSSKMFCEICSVTREQESWRESKRKKRNNRKSVQV